MNGFFFLNVYMCLKILKVSHENLSRNVKEAIVLQCRSLQVAQLLKNFCVFDWLP